MKTRLYLTLLLACAGLLAARAEIKYVAGSFHATNIADAKAQGTDIGSRNMTASLVDNWPMDYDGDYKTALVRVKFKNMAHADIRDKFNVAVSGGKHKVEERYQDVMGEVEYWVFIDSGDDLDLDFTQTEGLGSVRVPSQNYKPGQVYTLTLESGDMVTIHFNDALGGTQVYLDGDYKGYTPLSLPNISLGRHSVRYVNGSKERRDDIEVTKVNTNFNSETRTPLKVTFTTNEPYAGISIDDAPEEFFQNTEYETELYEGNHNVTVRSRKGTDDGIITPITVTPYNTRFDIKAFPTRKIDFQAMYANQSQSGATVVLDNPVAGYSNKEIGSTPVTEMLPYGKYNVSMTYYGQRKKGHLTVDANTPSLYSLTIPTYRKSYNPLQIDYKKRQVGLSFSYVQKSYSMKVDNKSSKYPFWDNNQGTTFHGFQIGLPIMPELGLGFIVNTGVFFEMYFSSHDYSSIGKTNFEECSLYAPVHLGYKLPVSETVAFYVSGGIGMDCGLTSELTFVDDDNSKESIKYGDEGMWNRFQLSGEVQAGFRFKALQLSFNYSKGILNNKNMVYEGATCKQQKMTFTLGFMF